MVKYKINMIVSKFHNSFLDVFYINNIFNNLDIFLTVKEACTITRADIIILTL